MLSALCRLVHGCFQHSLLTGGLLTLACLCSTPAHAAKGSAKSREDAANKARKACLAGDIQTGMTILLDLFVATRDPLWIYNQGRCFEQNGKYAEAISRFEEYLRLTKGSMSQDRESAQEHLADCQDKLAKMTVIVPPPMAPPVSTPPPPPQPEPAARMDEVKPAETAEPRRRVLRIAGITVGAVGVASLGGGLFFNLLANQTARDLNAGGGLRS